MSDEKQSPEAIARLMDRYCVDCHDGTEPTAGLNLSKFDAGITVGSKSWDTATWEKIVKRLAARQMQPADAEPPSEAEYQTVLTAMESVLDRAAAENNRSTSYPAQCCRVSVEGCLPLFCGFSRKLQRTGTFTRKIESCNSRRMIGCLAHTSFVIADERVILWFDSGHEITGSVIGQPSDGACCGG